VRQIRYTQALNEALHEEMERDPSVMQLGEDIGPYGGVWEIHRGLLSKFGPMRVRQTPISECGFIGLAVGAAMSGLRPVVEIMYIDFITTAMDQVINQAAKLPLMSGGAVKVPLVIRGEQGSGTREAAQHSQNLESWFVHTPGLKVVVPSEPADVKGLLTASLRDDDPIIFFQHKKLFAKMGPVPEGEYVIPLGKAAVKRQGKDVTILTYGSGYYLTIEAVKELAGLGIEAEVIDLRTLKPLDFKTIAESLKKTYRAVVVHEACLTGGFGAELVARISSELFDYLDAPVLRVATKDVPIPFSPPLEKFVLPSVEDIVKAVRQVTYC